MNLVSKSSLDNIWERHFLDSAQLFKFIKKIDGNIIDFGSGAGFPGLILAMMGHKKIHLVESDQKKCTFLREVAMVSETDIVIHNNRIENLDFINVELVTARALAPLKKLIEYVEFYTKKSPINHIKLPKMLFLKGKSYKAELLELSKNKKISYREYDSLTDKFAKILYINNVDMLNMSDE